MSAPVTIPEQYLAGTNSTFKIGDAPNQSTLAIVDGQWTAEQQVDEMTNSTSGGFYEDVPTIKRLTGNARCVYKAASLPQIAYGSLYTIEINTPGGPKVACTARLTQLGGVQMNPKAGLTFNIAFTSQGPVNLTGMG